MAINWKMSDVLLTSAFVVFVFAAITTMFIRFDNSDNVNGISDDLNEVSGTYRESYLQSEIDLENITSEQEGLVVKEQIFIDERGEKEAKQTEDESKANLINLKEKLKDNKYLSFVDRSIWIWVGSFIITLLLILGLKAILGDSRW